MISKRMEASVSVASWFRRLITPPAGIPDAWGYFYVGSTAAYLCGLSLQPLWIVIFFSLHAPIIASISIVMLLAFVLIIDLNRRGRMLSAIYIAFFEVTVHASLLTHYVGWQGCFHFYIMDLLAVWCVAPMLRLGIRVAGAVLAILLVVYLNHAYAGGVPYYHFSKVWMTFFMVQSIAAAHVILGVAVYYYAVVNARIFRDREQLRSQLAENRRIEGVAMLAGGVAHQFNNLLAGIMGNTELIGMDAEGGRSRRYLHNIIQACDKGKALSSSLLTYSGYKGHDAHESYALASLVRDCADRFVAEYADCRVALRIDAEDVAIAGYHGQVCQAVTALLANAREATTERPAEISVALGSARMTHAHITGMAKNFGLSEGDAVACLEVADHGEGIGEHTLHKLFEPFYTSRHQAGLGLSHVIGLLRMVQGAIAVVSEPGQGARFVLYLPLAR